MGLYEGGRGSAPCARHRIALLAPLRRVPSQIRITDCRAAAVSPNVDRQEEISQVIELINEARPLGAIGLFDVNRGTLCAIFGQVLTYLIICIQFQIPNNPH